MYGRLGDPRDRMTLTVHPMGPVYILFQFNPITGGFDQSWSSLEGDRTLSLIACSTLTTLDRGPHGGMIASVALAVSATPVLVQKRVGNKGQ